MNAKDLLKLAQLRNRGEAGDRLLESLENPLLRSQFAQGYGSGSYVVRGLDGSVNQSVYQSNSAIASGRAIASELIGGNLIIDQQPSRNEPQPRIRIQEVSELFITAPETLFIQWGDPIVSNQYERTWLSINYQHPGALFTPPNDIRDVFEQAVLDFPGPADPANTFYAAVQIIPSLRQIKFYSYFPGTYFLPVQFSFSTKKAQRTNIVATLNRGMLASTESTSFENGLVVKYPVLLDSNFVYTGPDIINLHPGDFSGRTSGPIEVKDNTSIAAILLITLPTPASNYVEFTLKFSAPIAFYDPANS